MRWAFSHSNDFLSGINTFDSCTSKIAVCSVATSIDLQFYTVPAFKHSLYLKPVHLVKQFVGKSRSRFKGSRQMNILSTWHNACSNEEIEPVRGGSYYGR